MIVSHLSFELPKALRKYPIAIWLNIQIAHVIQDLKLRISYSSFLASSVVEPTPWISGSQGKAPASLGSPAVWVELRALVPVRHERQHHLNEP